MAVSAEKEESEGSYVLDGYAWTPKTYHPSLIYTLRPQT